MEILSKRTDDIKLGDIVKDVKGNFWKYLGQMELVVHEIDYDGKLVSIIHAGKVHKIAGIDTEEHIEGSREHDHWVLLQTGEGGEPKDLAIEDYGECGTMDPETQVCNVTSVTGGGNLTCIRMYCGDEPI